MAEQERGRRVAVQGVVMSAKMEKTIVVDVARRVKHPVFEKYMGRATRFYAHDPRREAREGDLVEIVETRPLSKTKRWRLARIIKHAAGGEA
ncbi:MAG TPA: 30S ribosomal protein S17 [Planctomycetota bacterium]|jgi:small subunit ribosomal protein S17|nr:30S ribosomal protein S17 [Planctomycetota bacterium]OQC19582.1 MAG: 30S ribosomal protein S17 [Planctomycetes bacterium ADurb.Bin069]NMD36613.1 30S ribosomal protein S17 [Planctomycetota bacterium]HNR98993.1 30S ribosomal protein S17 [Planctomycetota bacterium]HNU27008.1 30S ribosomal protein S17 [Planctomycetota bacterium]